MAVLLLVLSSEDEVATPLNSAILAKTVGEVEVKSKVTVCVAEVVANPGMLVPS